MRDPSWAEIDQACNLVDDGFRAMSVREANGLRQQAILWFRAFEKVRNEYKPKEGD